MKTKNDSDVIERIQKKTKKSNAKFVRSVEPPKAVAADVDVATRVKVGKNNVTQFFPILMSQ